MDYIPYNSRNELHKYPFGAVKEEENIIFKIVMPREIKCSAVFLVIKNDGSETSEYHSFSWLSMEGDSEEWWTLQISLDKKGLYFYHFEYDTPWGRNIIREKENGIGLLFGGENDFHLTVYEKNFETPEWLKGGIIYQIFPDRFFNSKTEKKNVPSDRKLRDDIFGEPEWRPTKEGKVLNNDFFGGDLKGIEEKLSYISSLGVNCIYLNPIFLSHSNHRYDTADYEKIDPLLGTEKDFSSLCKKAEEKGISIILDGVFSHTGDDSVYFNKYGRYDSIGAFQSKTSPYYSWYKFTNYPNEYHSWWGISILPEIIEETPEFIEFITGEKGIVKKWMKLGARGWRLDVADELPDIFIDSCRKAIKTENPDGFLLGEVWEDASMKFSYGQRRRYLLGEQLDSVMNYPFADAVISFIRFGRVEGFSDKIMTILENYPKCVTDVLMNHIGTHDTMRAITALSGESCEYRDRQWQSEKKLSKEQYKKGTALLKLAAIIQFTLPGVPSVYYGDEAGMEGYKDPFNRYCYPWGRENEELVSFYRKLGKVRRECDCLKKGKYGTVSEMLSCLAFTRSGEKDEILVIINRNEHEIDYYLPEYWHNSKAVLGLEMLGTKVKLPALSGIILRKEKDK